MADSNVCIVMLDRGRSFDLGDRMVAGKHSQRKENIRLSTPGSEVALVHAMIVQAAKRGDRALKGRLSQAKGWAEDQGRVTR
jgi:hypothetical protein